MKNLDAVLFKWMVKVPLIICGLFFLGLVIIGIVGMGHETRDITLRHIVSPSFGCQSRKSVQHVIQMDVENDKQAAMQAIQDGIDSGECVSFETGDIVHFEDWKLTGLTKVRPQGSQLSYWTTTEAVSK